MLVKCTTVLIYTLALNVFQIHSLNNSVVTYLCTITVLNIIFFSIFLLNYIFVLVLS